MLDSIESEIIGLLINWSENHRTKNLIISTKTIVHRLIKAISLSGYRMKTCMRSSVSLDLEKDAWREERGTHIGSFVLFVRSGETRRAGLVYPLGVLQTKRTKAQFWARLHAIISKGANRRVRDAKWCIRARVERACASIWMYAYTRVCVLASVHEILSLVSRPADTFTRC